MTRTAPSIRYFTVGSDKEFTTHVFASDRAAGTVRLVATFNAFYRAMKFVNALTFGAH